MIATSFSRLVPLRSNILISSALDCIEMHVERMSEREITGKGGRVRVGRGGAGHYLISHHRHAMQIDSIHFRHIACICEAGGGGTLLYCGGRTTVKCMYCEDFNPRISLPPPPAPASIWRAAIKAANHKNEKQWNYRYTRQTGATSAKWERGTRKVLFSWESRHTESLYRYAWKLPKEISTLYSSFSKVF